MLPEQAVVLFAGIAILGVAALLWIILDPKKYSIRWKLNYLIYSLVLLLLFAVLITLLTSEWQLSK